MHTRTVTILSLGAFASAAGVRAGDPLIALIAAQYSVSPGAAGTSIGNEFFDLTVDDSTGWISSVTVVAADG